MEQLSQIVAQSMARHGCGSDIDHRRLIWSPWILCQWDDSLLGLPAAAGILALAEDVGALGPAAVAELGETGLRENSTQCHSERSEPQGSTVEEPHTRAQHLQPGQGFSAPTPDNSPRVLALFEITETDDLGAAFVRLFSPQSGYRDRLRSGRCFVRFTPVADAVQRQSATRALRDWLHNTEVANLAEEASAPPPLKESITAA